jgi:8-oxo-dGTP pyrophosphatase MutT (NUDIX family)
VTVYHPKRNDKGQLVVIKHPSQPTPLAAWADPTATATVVPGGPMPAALNGVPFANWTDVPADPQGWQALPGQALAEPQYLPHAWKDTAAGVVVEEADGRIWLVAPSNAYGGYTATFPKGRVELGLSLPASALKEAYEEAGLRVALTSFLADAERSQTRTRYYLARRLGGNPADMGWESQAVHLVPRAQLAGFLTNPNDLPLHEALLARPPGGGSTLQDTPGKE